MTTSDLDAGAGERYGVALGGTAPRLGHVNAVLAAQLAHRSVRAYLPDPLPDTVVPTLVAAAQSAATSSNLQLWSVIAVRDADRRARLARLAGGQAHVARAPLLLVWLADLARARRIAQARRGDTEGGDFVESALVAFVDAALAAQNAALAAESLGLGTVYIGALRNHPVEVAAELALPPHVVAAFGLVVGRPDPAVAAAVKPRLPQEVVLHHETYDLERQDGPVAAYDDVIGAFYAAEGLPGRWVDRVADRFGSVAGLRGRDRLRAALRERGFPLR